MEGYWKKKKKKKEKREIVNIMIITVHKWANIVKDMVRVGVSQNKKYGACGTI